MHKPDLKTISPWQVRTLLWIGFAALLTWFSNVYRPFFYLPGGRMGHDYGFVLPNWLDGHLWFSKNGLDVPWFTPSFCAGQPFFADPQSAYYSFPQLLDIAFGPVQAVYLTTCIIASMFFWGGYLLARQVFRVDRMVAMLVAALLMFNGFLPHRMIIGHATFHGFSLAPWIALLLLMPVRSRVNAAGAAALAGLLLAYWVQSGLGTLILPASLGIMLIGLLHCLLGGSVRSFLARSALAGIVALGLSAAKLTAAFAFLASFPRTFYKLPGADTLPHALAMVGGALFLPSQWANEWGSGMMTNQEFYIDAHEWAFNFSFAAAALLLALLVARMRLKPAFRYPDLRQGLLLFVLLATLIWPVTFNYFEPHWTAFLKTLPVINTTSTPLRWIVLYIPVMAIGLGLLLQRAQWTRWGGVAAVACVLGTVAQASMEPRDYYQLQIYDARPIVASEKLLAANQFPVGIKELGTKALMTTPEARLHLGANNTMAAGVSQLNCMNPVFGYNLEKFSRDGLSIGPVLRESAGLLNLKNPACYVFPKENNCKPGDLFRAEQLKEAEQFVAYQPFAFNISRTQQVANLITKITLLLLPLGALAWLAAWLTIKTRPVNA